MSPRSMYGRDDGRLDRKIRIWRVIVVVVGIVLAAQVVYVIWQVVA